MSVLSLVLLAAALLAAPAAADARQPPPGALQGARYDGLGASDRAFIKRVVEASPARARRLIASVAPLITFRRGAEEEAGRGDLAETEISGDERKRFVVAYGPQTLLRDPRGRHMVLHEIAHVVDNALLDDSAREDFTTAFVTAPLWLACYPQPTGSSSRCVPWAEIFADQFAFYANGDRLVRSSYGVPPLLGRRHMGELLNAVTAPIAPV